MIRRLRRLNPIESVVSLGRSKYEAERSSVRRVPGDKGNLRDREIMECVLKKWLSIYTQKDWLPRSSRP